MASTASSYTGNRWRKHAEPLGEEKDIATKSDIKLTVTSPDETQLDEKTGLLDSSMAENVTRSESVVDSEANKVLDIVVYLRDRSGISFTLEDGHLARADELLELAADEQGLTAEAKEIFALWLVSPYIDLRLKKHHLPYQVVQQWDELCAVYTDEKLEDIQKAEPVLMVQRDVFYPRDLEQNITNEQILCLLYHEAKFNIIEGRYVMPPNDYHELAGVQALIHLGRYDASSRVLAEYRTHLVQFYPEHMYQKKRLRFSSQEEEEQTSCEKMFQEAHRHASEEFHVDDMEKILPDLYRRYLQICWSHPFYGSAFFDGQVETPAGRLRKLIKSPPDTPVWVAINTECVSIIDRNKNELMLSIPLTHLLWEFRDAEFDVDNDSIPVLYLQFLCDSPQEEGQQQTEVTKLLEVYSRQARLMDALINSCVERKKNAIRGYDYVDGQIFQGVKKDSNRKILNRLDNLCLTTYTKDGQQVE